MEEIEDVNGANPVNPPSSSDKTIDKLNRLATGQLKTGKVTDATDTKLYNTDLGKSKYDKDIIIPQHLDPENFVKSLQEYRARKQPVSDQIGNAAVKFVPNVLLGTLGQLGSALDFGDYKNADDELGNWLTNLTDSAQDKLGDEFKNYRKNPGEAFAMGDSAWWVDTVSSLVESVGSFALTGGVLAKGLTGLSKLVKAQKIAKAMHMGGKTSQVAGEAFNTIGNAVMLNHAEGMMEATDVMENTYQYQMSQNPDMDPAEARKIAVNAGVTTLNVNRANIALNLTSANLFFRAGRYSNSAMRSQKISKIASAKRGLQEGSQESLEELINMWAGKRGTAEGQGKDYSFKEVIDDLISLEALEAATLGFVGGMGQTVATAEGVNRFMMMGDPENEGQKISIRDYNKRQYANAKKTMSELDSAFSGGDMNNITSAFKNQADTLKLINEIRKAEDSDDTAKAEKLKGMLLSVQAESAFDKGIADHLIKLYEGLGSGEQREGMGNDYKQKAQEAVAMIKDLQKIYDKNVGYEAGKSLYKNRAARYIMQKGLKGAKEEIAVLQSALAEEVARLIEGTELSIDPNFTTIPEEATAEEIKIYQRLQESDEYQELKALEGTLIDINDEIDQQDAQYKELKSDKVQEAFKKVREQMQSGEVSKKEEEAIEKVSDEIEKQAEEINDAKIEEKKEKDLEEVVEEVTRTEEIEKEEAENEFDYAVKNYSVGEQIPITSKLVDGLEADQEYGGTLIEVDEEAGTMLVELEDGTVLTIHKDRKLEIAKPEIHTEAEADYSTEGGDETKIAKEDSPIDNTLASGEIEGGAKVISRMDDGTPLLTNTGEAWMENQFKDFLDFERLPEDKRGREVKFEVNIPYTDNQRKAVNIYNKKVKGKKDIKLSDEELNTLYYHLPILANFGGTIKAPIENETKEENRTEGNKSVENFEKYTLPLRKGIIDALVAGKDLNNIYTTIQDQFKGILKVAPKENDKVVENNVMDLDFVRGDFSKVDLWVVNDDNDLENKFGDVQSGGMAGKGEIYLMIKRANGEPYRLKLNVKRLGESESEVVYQLYKLILLNPDITKATRLNKLPKEEKAIIEDLAKDAIKVLTGTGMSKNDLMVKDLIDFFVWDLTLNEKTRIRMDKNGFTFGNTTIDGRSIADNKEAFKTWLQENKRHHIKFKSKKNDNVRLNAQVDNYVKYLLEKGILNTNAVVNEPTFQKRTHIYLEPKAKIKGEESTSIEVKSKEKVDKSIMKKKGMSRAEAIVEVDKMFQSKIIEKKKELLASGVKRHLAGKEAAKYYEDEIANALEEMLGVSTDVAPIVEPEVPKEKPKKKKPVKKEPIIVKGKEEVEKVDTTIPEIKKLKSKFDEDIETLELAFNNGNISSDDFAKEKQEMQDKFEENVREISDKIRKVQEKVVSLEEIQKQERAAKLAAKRAARGKGNPPQTPPNKIC